MSTRFARRDKRLLAVFLTAVVYLGFCGCQPQSDTLIQDFQSPPQEARPWVYWYWMEGAVSGEGVHADLVAMKDAGIGGAYLMPIRGVVNPPWISNPVIQLTPEWWKMVRYSMQQADSLGLRLAMHVGDGFALAGGPWITPELSMQKVVWSSLTVNGGQTFKDELPQPETNEGYYRDIAVFACPAVDGDGISTVDVRPEVTTSVRGADVSFLTERNSRKLFKSDTPCWIQYTFKQPFTCRSVIVRKAGNKYSGSYQGQRLQIQVSDDGTHFRTVTRLLPPRQGWQDWDAAVTHEIEPVSARYFRFIYDPAGSEKGSEDLDAAKWKKGLEISGIELSSSPRINQFEGKSGLVWRISPRTTKKQLPESLCVPMDKMINITDCLRKDGTLDWTVPDGRWTIIRMGHTSTGYRNSTGGGGKGLECDKLNPEAVKLQFENWYGKILENAGPDLQKVLTIFHVDSWECGSQNWSPVFVGEFKKRRGYDPLPYLPVLAGIPVQDNEVSERFLYDVRETISELIADNFYKTLAGLLKSDKTDFSAESVAPTMMSDGMLHFKEVDIPMGEFWIRSESHDKPNDMLDAISGARIYGKNLVQAEAFTALRIAWDETPALLKRLGDRNYAKGINRFVYHVFMGSPWTDRKPGMTLNGLGTFLQRDQTWWKPGHAWITYSSRCQSLLQKGTPVTDVAVFTGEEFPRRALLPDRVQPFLPGIFGRNENGCSGDSIVNPADPMNGYAWDSFNCDALLRLASVRDGKVIFPGSDGYRLLVIPGSRKMNPDGDRMSIAVASRLLELVKEGATVLFCEWPRHTLGLGGYPATDDSLRKIIDSFRNGNPQQLNDNEGHSCRMWQVGRGRVIEGPYALNSFSSLGFDPDFRTADLQGNKVSGIAWAHRDDDGAAIYFVSNQKDEKRVLQVSLRTGNKVPELFDPVSGEVRQAGDWKIKDGRMIVPLRLEPDGSVFIVLRKNPAAKDVRSGSNWFNLSAEMVLDGRWNIRFDRAYGGPDKPVNLDSLTDWTINQDPAIRFYSGTAVYRKSFQWEPVPEKDKRFWIDLGKVASLADVTVNGIPCGVAWTPPYRVEVTGALKAGTNTITVAVTNTWRNRLIGDHELPEEERVTWTNAPYRLEGKPLLPSGLLGPVTVCSSEE